MGQSCWTEDIDSVERRRQVSNDCRKKRDNEVRNERKTATMMMTMMTK